MKRTPRFFLKWAFVLAVVALALAATVGACSLHPFSSQASSTTLTGPGETWVLGTATTQLPKRPTSTSDWRTTSTTVPRSTTTTAGEEHHSTGDSKAIAAGLKSSVVLITDVTTTNTTGYIEQSGTGVVYEQSGSYAYIVTSNHVIVRDDGKVAKKLRVTLPSGSVVTPTVVGRDASCDLAVLRVKSKKVTPAVFRTDLSQLWEGDFVVAIAKPEEIAHPLVSGTVVSVGPARELLRPEDIPSGVADVILSTAPVVRGFSGGPLLDYQGRVIGINMAMLRDEEGAVSLPADFVVDVVERLLETAE